MVGGSLLVETKPVFVNTKIVKCVCIWTLLQGDILGNRFVKILLCNFNLNSVKGWTESNTCPQSLFPFLSSRFVDSKTFLCKAKFLASS